MPRESWNSQHMPGNIEGTSLAEFTQCTDGGTTHRIGIGTGGTKHSLTPPESLILIRARDHLSTHMLQCVLLRAIDTVNRHRQMRKVTLLVDTHAIIER